MNTQSTKTPRRKFQLTAPITSPDAGELAAFGSFVFFVSEDENGYIVETENGVHQFYVDADEVFEVFEDAQAGEGEV